MMSNRSGKLIAFIALTLLIGAPIVSYFYLNEGYEYRLETLRDLEVKGVVQPFNIVKAAEGSIQETDLKGRVTVLSHLDDSPTTLKFVGDLTDQYSDRPEFQMISLGPSAIAPEVNNWKHVQGTDSASKVLFSEITSGLVDMTPPYYILVDSALSIRKIYPDTSESVRMKLVEHIAVILPRSKDSDIIHKSQSDEK